MRATGKSEDSVGDAFVGLPRGAYDGASVVVLGADHGSPYKPGVASHAAGGADAIRKGSQMFAGQLGQFDFDLGFAMAKDEAKRAIVDGGDLALTLDDGAANRAKITAEIRAVLDAGAVPLMLGGDDSVPIPVMAAYEGRGPITIIQIDAHVDWADVVQGNPYGFGSPMRRASEMPWFTDMRQVGIRGLGSGAADQHDDARRWGSRIVTMDEIERVGMEGALEGLEPGGGCFVSFDLDALDPSIMPAVNTPTPGGLSYRQASRLLREVARRRKIVGAAIVEFTPARDPTGLAAMTAARLALTLLGLIAEQRGVWADRD